MIEAFILLPCHSKTIGIEMYYECTNEILSEIVSNRQWAEKRNKFMNFMELTCVPDWNQCQKDIIEIAEPVSNADDILIDPMGEDENYGFGNDDVDRGVGFVTKFHEESQIKLQLEEDML